MKKSREETQQETWKECPGLTDSGRLFVSSTGQTRFQLTVHTDDRTGRPYVLIDNCPVFLDSLVLSMFGKGRPRRCYNISHNDDDPANCSVTNLEWTSVQLRQPDESLMKDGSDTNLSYLISRTITPEMVRKREYPPVERTSAENMMMLSDLVGIERPEIPDVPKSQTISELSRELDDLRSVLTGPATSRDVLMRRLAKMIADELCYQNPMMDAFRDLNEDRKDPSKYMKRIYIPRGYTVVRRKEPDGTYAWYRVSEEAMSLLESILKDVYSGNNPLKEYVRKWKPYGKPRFEYLGDYIFDGNEISDYIDGSDMKQDYGEDEGGRPPGLQEVNDIDNNGEFPYNKGDKSGQVDVQNRFDTKHSYSQRDNGDISYRGDFEGSSGGCADVHMSSTDSSSVKLSPSWKDIQYLGRDECLNVEPVDSEIRPEETGVYDVIARRLYNAEIQQKMLRKRENEREELSLEQLNEIEEGLKTMSIKDFKDLHMKHGGYVELEGGGAGKPVIVTDMRNMREFYCESIKKCAELLGTSIKTVNNCIRGKTRQIGNYQVRLKNGSDAILILQGIYGEYMKVLEEKRKEMISQDEEAALQQELDDINSEIEKMMQEKDV